MQELELNQPARFSFVSIVRTTSPPSLLSGEYRDDGSIQGLLLRWNLDAVSGRLIAGAARQALVTGQKRVQGALSQNGRYWLSCSGGEAHLFRTAIGVPSTSFTWPWGAEDLTCSPLSGNLWMATEHPGERIVFAVRMADY